METAVEFQLGVWTQRRFRFLKEHRPVLHTNLLTSDALDAHLQEIDERAEEWVKRLTNETAQREGITEEMKAADPLAWAQDMSSIQARVREIINSEIIFV